MLTNAFILFKEKLLYDLNRKKTSMYLIKGDRVKIIKTEFDSDGTRWYFINYKGKKKSICGLKLILSI